MQVPAYLWAFSMWYDFEMYWPVTNEPVILKVTDLIIRRTFVERITRKSSTVISYDWMQEFSSLWRVSCKHVWCINIWPVEILNWIVFANCLRWCVNSATHRCVLFPDKLIRFSALTCVMCNWLIQNVHYMITIELVQACSLLLFAAS